MEDLRLVPKDDIEKAVFEHSAVREEPPKEAKSGHSSFQRRPALDGIRAFAAMAVVLFHADTPGFARGYLGVDVFFVLSGFLVVSLILTEMVEKKSFDYLGYAFRRIRRLLPLSLFVLLLTSIAHKLFSNPLTVMEDRLSFLAAALYHANWRMLWDSNDYFAASGISPVQHYWSLSAEEQLQAITPLIIWALMAFRGYRVNSKIFLVALLALTCASIYRVVYLVNLDQIMWAYLGTFERSYQLLSGAIIAVLSHSYNLSKLSPVLGRIFSVFGFIAFFVFGPNIGIINLDTINIVQFCGMSTVLSVLLVGGMEMAPTSNPMITFFSLSPLCWIGVRSYAIYLIHFPIVIIGNSLGLTQVQPWRTLIVVFFSIFLGYLLHRFIEEPTKYFSTEQRVKFILGGLVISALIGAFCYHIMIGNAFVQDLYLKAHPQDQSLTDFVTFNGEPPPPPGESFLATPDSLKAKTPSIITKVPPGDSFAPPIPKNPIILDIPSPAIPTPTLKPKGARIVLGGDSVGPKWGLALRELIKRGYNFTLREIHVSGCPIYWNEKEYGKGNYWDLCRNMIVQITDAIKSGTVDMVFFPAMAGGYDAGSLPTEESSANIKLGLETTLQKWTPYTQLVVLSPFNIPSKLVPQCVAGVSNPTPAKISQECDSPSKVRGNFHLWSNMQFDVIPKYPNAHLYNATHMFCPDGFCKATTPSGRITWDDNTHPSNAYVMDDAFIKHLIKFLKDNCIDLERGMVAKPCIPS